MTLDIEPQVKPLRECKQGIQIPTDFDPHRRGPSRRVSVVTQRSSV